MATQRMIAAATKAIEAGGSVADALDAAIRAEGAEYDLGQPMVWVPIGRAMVELRMLYGFFQVAVP